MMYLFLLWVALGAVIAGIAIYRKMVSREEDDAIHLNATAEGVIQQQTVMAGKLNVIDRWGKTLTAVEVLFGLALGLFWLYKAWLDGSKLN
jgi:hypothetical protein